MLKGKRPRPGIRYSTHQLLSDIHTHFGETDPKGNLISADDLRDAHHGSGLIYVCAVLSAPPNTLISYVKEDVGNRRRRTMMKGFQEHTRGYLFGALERMNTGQIEAKDVEGVYLEIITEGEDSEASNFSALSIEGNITRILDSVEDPIDINYTAIGKAVFRGSAEHLRRYTSSQNIFAEYKRVLEQLQGVGQLKGI